GSLDNIFNPSANDTVLALAAPKDGKIFAGGFFTTIHGQSVNYIARLLNDGTVDSGFNPGASDAVYSLLLQNDGKLLFGGLVTSPAPNLARLQADGSLDTSFSMATNNNAVYCLAQQSDGKLLVGGDFTVLGGQLRNHIGRLYKDGATDADLEAGAEGNVNSVV